MRLKLSYTADTGKGATYLQNSLTLSCTISIQLATLQLIPRYLPRKMKMYLYTNIHISFIYNIQNLETIQMPINQWIDKTSVMGTYNGISPSSKKEWTTDTKTQVSLKSIMVSEIRQTKEFRYCMISFGWSSRVGNINLQ